MFLLTLRRDGKIFNKEHKKVVSNKGEILCRLNYAVELEKGFTVRDLFRIVTNYKALQLLDNFYQPFLKEVKKCPPSGCKERGMAAIAIQRVCSTTFGENHTYIDVHAALKKPDKDNQSRYGVDFMPLKKILDLPIIFDPILICSMSKDAKEEYRYEHSTEYTLWELVHGFIWEISFYGVPAERDKQKKHLDKVIKEVKDGTAVTYSFDEVLDHLGVTQADLDKAAKKREGKKK